jgi:anaerobic C4-dicarboxylate transporter
MFVSPSVVHLVVVVAVLAIATRIGGLKLAIWCGLGLAGLAVVAGTLPSEPVVEIVGVVFEALDAALAGRTSISLLALGHSLVLPGLVVAGGAVAIGVMIGKILS